MSSVLRPDAVKPPILWDLNGIAKPLEEHHMAAAKKKTTPKASVKKPAAKSARRKVARKG